MNIMTEWRTKDLWTWKKFVLLLLVKSIFIMFGVKYGAQNLHQFWLDNASEERIINVIHSSLF